MELKELAQRIRSGDRDALRELIAEYGVGIYKKAYEKTQDKTLAREATRQTFAQLVTALQEQTDMDGWELWLNALARRNIETYSNVGADMAFMEQQLDSRLFGASDATPALPSPAQAAAQQFALQQQYEAQQAAERAAAEQALQQQYFMQQQYEAQQAAYLQQAAQQQQYAAQQAAAQQAAQPASAPDGQNPHGKAPLKSDPHRGKKRAPADRLFDGAPQEQGKFPWLTICFLIPLCLILVWLLIGVSGSMGWIPVPPLGYEWFNTHVFDLF